MPEIVSDALKPYETPIEGANDIYLNQTNPGYGAYAAGTFEKVGTLPLARGAVRGTQADASWYDRALAEMSVDPTPEATSYSLARPTTPAEVTPTLQPDDANERYAPRDIAGKIIPITDKPISEGLAKILGQQKTESVKRDSVLARFYETHSGLTSFAVGTAVSMLDPLNAALLLVPPLGEGAILARVGAGFLGRTTARLGAGATTGALITLPQIGLHAVLDPEEASEYGMRDALHELFYGAAGFAAFHAGFGVLRDVYRTARGIPLEGAAAPPPTAGAPDAATTNAIMRSGIAQIKEGREFDISNYFPPRADTAIGLAMNPPFRVEIVGEANVEAQARRLAPEIFARYDTLTKRAAELRTQLFDPEGTFGREIDGQVAALRARAEAARSDVPPVNLTREELAARVAEQTRVYGEATKAADALAGQRAGMIHAHVAAARLAHAEIDAQLRDIAGTGELAKAKSEAGNIVEARRRAGAIDAELATPPPAPAPLVGGVAGDVERQMIAAGRSPEEAATYGKLIQTFYQASSDAEHGLRSAEEIYRAEGPDIVGGGSAEELRAGELGQPRVPTGPLGSDLQERNLTVLDILSGVVPARPVGSSKVERIAAELETRGRAALRALGVRVRSIEGPDPRTDEIVSRAIATEIKAALQRDGHAFDWYTGKVEEALQIASILYPELRADPHARTAFTAAMAITSQGERVGSNVRLTILAYEQFRETGRFPTSLEAKKAKYINGNFAKFNKYLDLFGPEELTAFLNREYTVRELEQATGIKVSGENKDTLVRGSAIFGPKIGQGFFQNLNGNYTPVTMDLWFMRAWGRLVAKLTGASPKTLTEQRTRFENAMRDEGRDVPQTRPALERRAREVVSQHERDFKEFRDEFNAGTREKGELTLSAERFLHGRNAIIESPTSGNQRNWIRARVERARELLASEGVHVTSADLQALWWYPEKSLYEKMGGEDAEAINIDYASALREAAAQKGISNEQIAAATAVGPLERRPGSAGGADVGEATGAVGEGGAGVAQAEAPGAAIGPAATEPRAGAAAAVGPGSRGPPAELEQAFEGRRDAQLNAEDRDLINQINAGRRLSRLETMQAFRDKELWRAETPEQYLNRTSRGLSEEQRQRFIKEANDMDARGEQWRSAPTEEELLHQTIDLKDYLVANDNVPRAAATELEQAGRAKPFLLTPEHRRALREYQDDGTMSPEAEEAVNRSTLGRETTVYRGHSTTSGVRARELTSATLDEEAAKDLAREHPNQTVSKIVIDPDAPALEINRRTTGTDLYDDEHEILLGNGRFIQTGPNEYRFERAPTELEQAGRAKIRTATAEARALITLFREADESSAGHEFAHHAAIQFFRNAASPFARPELRADASRLRRWLGMDEGQERLTRAQQEQLAQGFEQYMMEGKAPTPELNNVFAKLRDWLTRIYRDATALGVPINDEVRGVFDRWFAAPEETGGIHRSEINLDGKPTTIEGPAPPPAGRAPDLIDLAIRQRAEQRAGWAPAVSASELAAANDAVYGPRAAAAPAPAPRPGEARGPVEAPPHLEELEAQVARIPPEAIHPDDRAMLEQSAEAVQEATAKRSIYETAAACILGLAA